MNFVTTLDDPRIAGYRNLRERDLRGEGLFITEGSLLAERLLESRYPVQSLFVTTENAPRYARLLGDKAPLYVAEPTLMRQIVGFDFHRGVLGLGQRTPFPSIRETVEQLASHSAHFNLLVCPATETAENLGLILRSAAAFGIDGLLLPHLGADPLSRRCLRQSMGHALSSTIATSDDLLTNLQVLRETTGLRLIAAVAGDYSRDGKHQVTPLPKFVWPPRAALVIGNEYSGLSQEWLDGCDHFVTIPVAPTCDSLNAAVATGILLYHMGNPTTAPGVNC